MIKTADIPNQPIALAEYLGVELDTLRKMMHNKQLIDGHFSRYAELEPSTVETLVGIYQPENRKNGATGVVSGKTESNPLNGDPSGSGTTVPQKRKSGTTNKRKANTASGKTENAIAPTGKGVQALLLLVALASMYVQMDHTAQVIIAEKAEVRAYDLSKAWMFAFGVQFTGLSMSLFKGNQWYLRGYALADFIINLLYYRPWVDNTAETWTQSLLLSGLLVLTIFSYTQIATGFLKAKKRNNE